VKTPTDCRSCGVCCFSRSESYVAVTGHDWSRLGAEAERLAVFSNNRAFMRMIDGHCAALIVRPDESGGRDRFCSVYERRPQICRALERGSPECAGERATKAQSVAQYQPASVFFMESLPGE
jgi:uncharacterized protein